MQMYNLEQILLYFLSFISAIQIFNEQSNGELWQLPVHPLNYVSCETCHEYSRIITGRIREPWSNFVTSFALAAVTERTV